MTLSDIEQWINLVATVIVKGRRHVNDDSVLSIIMFYIAELIIALDSDWS